MILRSKLLDFINANLRYFIVLP